MVRFNDIKYTHYVLKIKVNYLPACIKKKAFRDERLLLFRVYRFQGQILVIVQFVSLQLVYAGSSKHSAYGPVRYLHCSSAG